MSAKSEWEREKEIHVPGVFFVHIYKIYVMRYGLLVDWLLSTGSRNKIENRFGGGVKNVCGALAGGRRLWARRHAVGKVFSKT